MGKLNIANINAGLNKVKSITETLSNTAHFENVPIDCIKPAENNPYASNDTDEDLYELAISIQANGLINPLSVNKVSDSEYQLISGERRFSAIKEYLNFKSIPCMVYDKISENAAQLKLHIANLDVREYTTGQKLQFYTETEQLLKNMKESGEFTGAIQQGIADLLGVSTRQVRKYKSISENLSEDKQQSVINGELSVDNAYRLANSEKEKINKDNENQNDKTGSTSAFDIDFWEDKIGFALKKHYDRIKVFEYYTFEVPNTKDCIKEILKPKCGYSGGTITFPNEVYGSIECSAKSVELVYEKKRCKLSYIQIDSYIRELIRNEKWLTKGESQKVLQKKLNMINRKIGSTSE